MQTSALALPIVDVLEKALSALAEFRYQRNNELVAKGSSSGWLNESDLPLLGMDWPSQGGDECAKVSVRIMEITWAPAVGTPL